MSGSLFLMLLVNSPGDADAAGTVSCRNRLETGAIARIDINGRRLWLRVMLGDGSSCLFTSLLAHGRLRGGYECLQGAGLVEQGSWWVERSYFARFRELLE